MVTTQVKQLFANSEIPTTKMVISAETSFGNKDSPLEL